MNQNRLNITLLELCEIPSPSQNERQVADYILDRVSSLGVDVVEDEAVKDIGGNTGNLVVRLSDNDNDNDKPSLLLSAHMDTVDPKLGSSNKINVMVSDGIVHTDGKTILGADDKAGVAIALEMIHYVVENPGDLVTPLEIVFTVQEEIGVLGASYLKKTNLVSKCGFVLDGDTEVGTVIVKSPYKWKYFLDVLGKSAHAALDPEKGINAIKVLSSIIGELPCGRIDNNTVTNYGIVSGGTTTNVVTDQAKLIGELRGHDIEKINYVQTEMFVNIQKITQEFGANFDINWTSLYSGYVVSNDSQCMQYFMSACSKLGIEPKTVVTDGGGDANHLNGAGINCVPFGLGMKAIHTNQEHISLADLHLAFNLLLECLRQNR